MKKIIALLLCCMCIILSGCSGKVADVNKENTIDTLDGVWRQFEFVEDSYLEAVVVGDVITINIVQSNGVPLGVYWYGNAPVLSEAVDDYQWISECDLSKIHYSLVSGSDKQKHFIYKDGCLWLPYSMADYSVIMRLERVEE